MSRKNRRESMLRYSPARWFVIVLFSAVVAVVSVSSPIHGETARVLMMAKVTDYAKAYTNMGRDQLRNGNYLRAVRLLNSAIAKGGSAQAFKLRGEAYARLGKFERALADLTHYVSSKPRDPSGYILRGWCHILAQDNARAYQDYQRALQLEPSDAKALLGRGIAAVALEDYEQAIQDFRKVLSVQPENQDALVNLGLVYMLSRNSGKALELLKKARETETDVDWRQKLNLWIEGLQERSGGASGTLAEPVHVEPDDRVRAPNEPESGARDSFHSGEPSDGSATRKTRSGTPENSAVIPPETAPTSRQSIKERLRGSDLFGDPAKEDKNLSGHWETTYLGARISMDVKHRGGKRISGVLRIRDAMGREDTYHYTGTFDRGNVYAYHHSGHLFRGRLTSTGRLVGSLRLKNGRTVRIDLTAK